MVIKKTGITTSTLNNLCNNKTSCVQFSVLDKICIALDCDVCDILKNYLFSLGTVILLYSHYTIKIAKI